VDLHLLLIPSEQPALGALLSPRTWITAPVPSPPRRGEPPFLCAHAHAPNRYRHPGNKPGRGSREVEYGQGRQQSDPSIAQDINLLLPFLWQPPAAALEPRSASLIPIALPVTARCPRPGRRHHLGLAATGDRCSSARDPTPAPRVHVPLFRPLEANPETGLLPPRYQYARSENFFKKSFPGNYPPGDGTRHQHFIYGRLAGPYCRRFKHFTAPWVFPMDAPFCGPWWGCGGPQRRRFIFPGGEGLGADSWCWCRRGARSGRNGEDAIPGRFLPACSFRCQPYLQGFRYTNDREKLARERLLAVTVEKANW
jgi:hypothetical protein